jgi:hypothetical protein
MGTEASISSKISRKELIDALSPSGYDIFSAHRTADEFGSHAFGDGMSVLPFSSRILHDALSLALTGRTRALF